MHHLFAKFLGDQRGNIAVLTAGMLVPLLALSVGALDMSSRAQLRDDLQNAAEHAVIASMTGSRRRFSDRQRLASNVFKANIQNREMIEKMQTRLRRIRVRGHRAYRFEVAIKVDSPFAEFSPMEEGVMHVSATAAQDLRSAAPPRLIPDPAATAQVKAKDIP